MGRRPLPRRARGREPTASASPSSATSIAARSRCGTARGQDVTAEFREGKDDYPVGKMLLGLDADEFEKCALVRQDELDQVVPADEKARRGSTLHARLENAADTRGRRHQRHRGAARAGGRGCAVHLRPRSSSPARVENAIQRLELQARHARDRDQDARARLRADRRAARGPGPPRRRGAGGARADARASTHERRDALAADVRASSPRTRSTRAELERLRAEAREPGAGRRSCPPTPRPSSARRSTRHEEAVRQLGGARSAQAATSWRASARKREAELAGLAAMPTAGPAETPTAAWRSPRSCGSWPRRTRACARRSSRCASRWRARGTTGAHPAAQRQVRRARRGRAAAAARAVRAGAGLPDRGGQAGAGPHREHRGRCARSTRCGTAGGCRSGCSPPSGWRRCSRV